jgi:RNA polymerase sigma factor (sigma-70 family)
MFGGSAVSARNPRIEGASLAHASDTALFEGIARGDLGPLGELFDRHHARVRAFAERVLPNAADADDLVQETFLTASRAAASFEPGAAAKPFLLGVAAQLARRRRRTFARLRAKLTAFGHAPSAPQPTPEDDLTTGEETLPLRAAVARLSHAHREVILLVDLGGLSGVEAATALGIPAGTVWRRLHEARAELRDKMKRRST